LLEGKRIFFEEKKWFSLGGFLLCAPEREMVVSFPLQEGAAHGG
jgi:hypothetical protein